jgi:tetratricopeptide (TPR) repeat protein
MSADPTRDPLPPAWMLDLLRAADDAEARGAHALAVAVLERIAAAAPSLEAQRRLGLALMRAGRPTEAAAPLRSALVQAPQDAQLRYALGLSLMAHGRFAEGARLCEARFELPPLGARKPAGFPYPEWRGEPLAGRHLAVFPELGLADQILAARFVRALIAGGTQVTLFATAELAQLFVESFPAATVLSAAGQVEFEDPDAWTMMSSLLALAAAGVPAPPYLQVKPIGRGRGSRVALAAGDLPPDLAQRLREGLAGEVQEVAEPADLAAAAAQLAAADLVVCGDGALAQLASALARPTLALVRARDPHWSFARGPQAPLWHPTVQLFRADPRGGWNSPVERLLLEAQARAAG